MLRKTGKHVVAVAIVMVVSATLVVTAAADKTIGQFVQDLARVKQLAATDPQVAADSLAATGIRLPADLDLSAPLTEGAVTEISRAIGLTVSTTNPDALFTADQADQFFDVFSGLGGIADSGISTRADEGTCVLDPNGACAQQGADCIRNGKPGFCMTTSEAGQPVCNCNTGKAKGKRKQVVTPGEPE